MGFFNRFFNKVEEVNNGEASISELEEEIFVGTTEEEAVE